MDTLNTKAQSIVGGINEVNSHVGDISQLSTSEKTSLVTAVNEVKEEVSAISDPYEINLTNLLSAEDSESISTAIGGIDNLNATVQDNRLIVGTISNGSVSVSIRILGNVTTLYYLLDSVLGLTLNEVAITNTSGTLSKSVTTHSVLTENMVINSLNSDETTLPLSAAQGKVLDSKIDSIDVSADITEAINALDSSGQTASTGEVISSVSQEDGVISVSKKTLTSDDIPELPQSKITDLDTALAAKADATVLTTHISSTSNPHSVTKEQVGLGNVDNTSDIDKPISTATQTELDSKQDTLTAGTGIEITPENQINVTLDTNVFKVVSALPDSPAQGDENKIHLVSAETSGANNTYTEYVWVNSAWEILGEYTSEVDLTPYLKTSDAESTYLKISDAESEYATKTELAGKQDAGNYVEDVVNSGQDEACIRLSTHGHGNSWTKLSASNGLSVYAPDGSSYEACDISINPSEVEDSALTTRTKNLTGAINEVKAALEGKQDTGNYVEDISSAISDAYVRVGNSTESDWIGLFGDGGITINVPSSLAVGEPGSSQVIISVDPSRLTDNSLTTTSKYITGAINEVRETLNSSKAYFINLTPIMSQAGNIVSKDVVDWDNLVTAVQNRVPIQVTQIMEEISDVILYDLQAIMYQSSDIPTVNFRFGGNGTDYTVILQLQSDSTNVEITVEQSNSKLDVTTLFAGTASITSGLSSQIAAYGQDSATDFPLMYAGASIGNIKPTWIRTSADITNFMCIADNKIWYFEIQGTTVQRASLAIS